MQLLPRSPASSSVFCCGPTCSPPSEPTMPVLWLVQSVRLLRAGQFSSMRAGRRSGWTGLSGRGMWSLLTADATCACVCVGVSLIANSREHSSGREIADPDVQHIAQQGETTYVVQVGLAFMPVLFRCLTRTGQLRTSTASPGRVSFLPCLTTESLGLQGLQESESGLND